MFNITMQLSIFTPKLVLPRGSLPMLLAFRCDTESAGAKKIPDRTSALYRHQEESSTGVTSINDGDFSRCKH